MTTTSTTPAPTTPLDRDDAIREIRAALKARSGRTWSVTGGRGTAWGWIRISSRPSDCDKYGQMTDADAALLGELLDLPRVGGSGASVPASSEHRAEYVARAKGEDYTAAAAYWD